MSRQGGKIRERERPCFTMGVRSCVRRDHVFKSVSVHACTCARVCPSMRVSARSCVCVCVGVRDGEEKLGQSEIGQEFVSLGNLSLTIRSRRSEAIMPATSVVLI